MNEAGKGWPFRCQDCGTVLFESPVDYLKYEWMRLTCFDCEKKRTTRAAGGQLMRQVLRSLEFVQRGIALTDGEPVRCCPVCVVPANRAHDHRIDCALARAMRMTSLDAREEGTAAG